jgi:hypothetical protein
MLQQGIQLLELFVQDGRVQIHQPHSHQQVRFTRTLSSGNSFVAFVDAVGELDSTPCVLVRKTSSARLIFSAYTIAVGFPKAGVEQRRLVSSKREYVALLVFIAMLSFSLSFIVSAGRAANRDFIVYWASSQLLDKGANPYDPTAMTSLEHSEGWLQQEPALFNNPPFTLVLTMPLGVLSARMANGLWIFLMVVCVVMSMHLIREIHGNPPNRIHLLGYTFGPILICLAAGQIVAFMLIGLVLFLLFYKSRPFTAGIALSVCAIKPHLLLPFGVALLLWTIHRKQARLVLGVATGILAACAIVLVVRPTVWGDYFTMLRSEHLENIFMPTPSAMLRLAIHPSWPWLQLVPAALACLWAAWYYLQHRGEWEWAGYEGYLLLLVSLFVAPRCWTTDEVLAVPALLALFYRGRHRVALGCLAAASVVATGELFFQVQPNSGLYVWTTTAWLACYLLATEPRTRAAENSLAASRVYGEES